MMKRTLVGLSALLLLLSMGAAGPAAAADKIKVGMLKPNVISVIYWIAVKTGAFEKNGLEVEEHPFPSGQTVAGIEQMLRGNIDVYIGAGAEVAHANSESIEAGAGTPLAIIQGADRGGTYVLLSNKFKGKTFDDLKNEPLRIGISNPSSIHLVLLRAFLNDRKMTTDDIKWKFLPLQAPDMMPALLSNQLDGYMHDALTATLTVDKDIGFVLMTNHDGSMGERLSTVTSTAVSANRAFMKKNPDVTKRFIKALEDASDSFDKEPREKMLAIMAEWTKQDHQMLEGLYARFDPRVTLTEKGAQTWWEVFGAAMRARKEIGPDVKMSDLFDLSLDPRR